MLYVASFELEKWNTPFKFINSFHWLLLISSFIQSVDIAIESWNKNKHLKFHLAMFVNWTDQFIHA